MPAPGEVVVGGRRPALPPPLVRRVVREVLRRERRQADISVTFLGPVLMRRLNVRFLRRDQPTDVIAFALPQPGGVLAGDIYVCRAVALQSARRAGVPLRQELIRLVIHGTLHVLGYDHPEGAGPRMQSPMWRRQERLVRALA